MAKAVKCKVCHELSHRITECEHVHALQLQLQSIASEIAEIDETIGREIVDACIADKDTVVERVADTISSKATPKPCEPNTGLGGELVGARSCKAGATSNKATQKSCGPNTGPREEFVDGKSFKAWLVEELRQAYLDDGYDCGNGPGRFEQRRR